MKKVMKKTVWWAGVLCLGIVLGVTIKVVGAWVEPNQMPPGGNIAAPLNTGNIGQSKIGGLTLNIGGATYGLIVDKGLVGIGTTAPGEKLEVNGNIKLTGLTNSNDNTVSPFYTIKNVVTPVENSDVATKGYVDALSGGTNNYTTINNNYFNLIVSITPPGPYTEICFKNGQVYYDVHGSSGSSEGGNCVPGDFGFIIEKSPRSANYHDEARFTCATIGMRLPEPDEFMFACGHKSQANVEIASGGEWGSNIPVTAWAFYGQSYYVGEFVPNMNHNNGGCRSSYPYLASGSNGGPSANQDAYHCVR